jgi:hypothetical protein
MSEWEALNNVVDIPDNALASIQKYTTNKLVIDYGAGSCHSSHINFLAKSVFRWDRDGVITSCLPVYGMTIEETIALNPKEKFTLVFSRVISVLTQIELLALKALLLKIKSSVNHIVVYDYLFNTRRLDEYRKINGVLGATSIVEVEWFDRPFYHYSVEQMNTLFESEKSLIQTHTIPAVNRNNDIGTLLIY